MALNFKKLILGLHNNKSHFESCNDLVKYGKMHVPDVQVVYTVIQIINHVSPKSWFWENCKKQSQCLHSYFNWNKL